MRFSPKRKALIALVCLTVVGAGAYTLWRQKKGSSHSEESTYALGASKLEELKGASAKVVPNEIEVYVKAPGIVDFHPKHALRIHPAFPGIVLNIQKQIGDRVNEGDTLATIESNVGIQVYNVTSPIKGIVLSKNIGSGQSVAPEDELFSVGDGSVLQARMAVSARDVNSVKAGQEVVLLAEDQRMVRSTVLFVSPILSEETRTASAIVNFTSTDLRPGMFVTGAFVAEKKSVMKSLPLAYCGDRIVKRQVFVLGPKGPESRTAVFGMSDYQNCEVLDGLNVDDVVIPTATVAMLQNESDEDHEHE